MINDNSRIEVFDRHRHRLFGIAYRMTGSTSDAEDIVQEAYLRWHKANADEMESAEAWLVTVTTRLAIDRLRKLQKERETYIGPWLPEPLFTQKIYTPEEQLELASNLSLAFLALLEKLAPTERAAFLLHDVFEISYEEISRIIEKKEAACRQLIHRARERVRQDRTRFEVSEDKKRRLIEKFIKAVEAANEQEIISLFAEDVTLTSDGGGKVTAARRVIVGNHKIARLYYFLGAKGRGLFEITFEKINGETGIVTTVFGQPFSAAVFEIENEKVKAIYQVMNPEKLRSYAKKDELLN